MLKLRFKRRRKPEFTLDDLRSVEFYLTGTAPGEDFEEVESYWLDVPYARASIQSNGREYCYCLLEPQLNQEERDLLRGIAVKVFERVPLHVSENDRETLFQSFRDVVSGMDLELETIAKLWYYLERDCFYAGKITPLLKDPLIEDISCSGYGKPVYVYHTNYESIPTNIVMTEEELDEFVLSVAQRAGIEISVANPIADTTLFDGSRVNVTFRNEVTDHGSTFNVRKIRKTPITPVNLVGWNTFSAEEMALLWLCVESNCSMLFIGGTAAGKTTALNATALFIPPHAKIVTIEDTREVVLPHENWIPGVANDRVTMFDLLKSALRQRPEYVIVGEVRGKEAEVMFQAMSLGHTCLATIHGSSAESVIDRLTSPPYELPKQLVQTLDLIAVLARFRTAEGKAVRRCTGLWFVDEDCELREVCRWDFSRDHHGRRGGYSDLISAISDRTGRDIIELEWELEQRTNIVRSLVESGADYESFISTVREGIR